MEDLRIYDFDFNLLYILPAYSSDSGYVTIDARQDMNDAGSFEAVIYDSELMNIIKAHKDNLLVVWGKFQGFITSYQKQGKQIRLMGMHLNGLLHRSVIPSTDTELSGDVETLAISIISKNIQWLTIGSRTSLSNAVKYATSKYITADIFLQDLFKLDGAGYQIRADVSEKKFIFEVIARHENPLILSEQNLNAYNINTTYINKDIAFGGWYKDEATEKWMYLTTGNEKSDVYMIDTVLDATTATEAKNELKNRKAEYQIEADTKNIVYGEDYNIGDIIRVQDDDSTTRQLVSGVSFKQNRGYIEQPILTDYEEV